MENENINKDCQICQKLIKQKHKNDFFYKVGFFVMLAISVILSALYFGNSYLAKKVDIKIVTNGGSVDSNIIGENTVINGTVTNNQNALGIICLALVVITALIGGVIIANHYIRTHNNLH